MNDLIINLWLLFLIAIFAGPFVFWMMVGVSALFIKNLALGLATVFLFFAVVYTLGLRFLGV